MAKVAHLTRVSESPMPSVKLGRYLQTSDCSRSPAKNSCVSRIPPWKIAAIGTYNHIVTVLAPATPELCKWATGHPDGAHVYELTGTAVEFMAHATVWRTISRPKSQIWLVPPS